MTVNFTVSDARKTDPTNNSIELAMLDQHVAGMFAGLKYAYAAVCSKQGYGLGVAVKNSAGYTPCLPSRLVFKTFDEASIVADGMNRHIGLDDYEAMMIIASSMRQR